jgi:hypothetical protein
MMMWMCIGVENEVNMDGMNDEEEEMSMKELIVDMSKLKSGKSPGVDGVTSEMLKCGGPMFMVRLLELFNVCFKCAKRFQSNGSVL